MEKPYLIVLGAGESGVWTAILAQQKGFRVLLSEAGEIAPKYKTLCTQYAIPTEEGGHQLPHLAEATEVVKSPGIPDSAPVVQRCRELGVPIVSEIEWAARYAGNATFVAVTGSNGKTTTTSLIAHVLQEAGMDAMACGNIGTSLAQLVCRDPHHIYVLELSSFQLDHMYQFRAHIALLTNITPDHLDRYNHQVQHYADAKGRIFQNQQSSDIAIYNADDPLTRELLKRLPPLGAEVYTFSGDAHSGAQAYYTATELVWYHNSQELRLATNTIPLKGPHNYQNVLAAGLVALQMGVPFATLAKGIASFKAIEHRMEPCGTIGGVTYINDSKATNTDSTLHALKAMPTHRTVLILGGTDKGNNYNDILLEVQRSAKALVFLTRDSSKLHATFDALGLPTADAHSLPEAFGFIESLELQPGDVVLLSPACASFDLFRNYEERGTLFKQAVSQLCNSK